jgi:hypothetical protein
MRNGFSKSRSLARRHRDPGVSSTAGNIRGAVKDAEALQTGTRQAEREAQLRRDQNIGLALIFGSYASFALPFAVPSALPIADGVVTLLYFSMSIIGVVLYAKGKQRRLWWGVLGFLPVLGPLLGLWILSWKPKARTKTDFRGGSVASVVASIVAIFLTSSSLVELAASIYLPGEQWYPGHQYGGGGLFLFLSPFILFIPASVVGHLNKYEFASTKKLKPFLITETVFAGLFLFSVFSSFYVTAKIVDVHETRSENILSQLQVGTGRHRVETLVLEANASLVAPPREGPFGTTEYQNELYRGVQQALEAARNGETVDFSTLDGKQYFAMWSDNGNPSIQRFKRTYILGAFHDINYELLVKYDDTDRLLWARYVSQTYNDGPGSCRVVYVGDSAPAWNSDLCLPMEVGEWKTKSR